MWKYRLCLGTSASFGDLSVPEQIRKFKEVGFDGFFTEWYSGAPVEEWARIAQEENMIYQSIHAPFTKVDALWRDDEEKAEAALEELLECLRDCKKAGVPRMILHVFIGFEDHDPTEIGLQRYGVLVDEAEKLGVKLALENTEGEEYLYALMDRFKDRECVGFCWDTGHELCYNHSKDLLADFGSRLICTHINDNLGIKDYNGRIFWHDDLHLLPFDDIADWKGVAERLDRWNYQGELTFELTTLSKPNRHENDAYARMSIDEYLTEAFKRACRVAALRKID